MRKKHIFFYWTLMFLCLVWLFFFPLAIGLPEFAFPANPKAIYSCYQQVILTQSLSFWDASIPYGLPLLVLSKNTAAGKSRCYCSHPVLIHTILFCPPLPTEFQPPQLSGQVYPKFYFQEYGITWVMNFHLVSGRKSLRALSAEHEVGAKMQRMALFGWAKETNVQFEAI